MITDNLSKSLSKGEMNGLCNRSSCGAPGATWYNCSTKAHYCGHCAGLINKANHAEALLLYGHPLCLPMAPLSLNDLVFRRDGKGFISRAGFRLQQETTGIAPLWVLRSPQGHWLEGDRQLSVLQSRVRIATLEQF